MKYRAGGWTIFDCEIDGSQSYMIDYRSNLCHDNGIKDNDCKVVDVNVKKIEICCCVDDL